MPKQSYEHSGGYIMVYSPKHPACDHSGYVYQHRLIVEKKIGRFLSGKEIVHHLNGDPSDNRVDNLILLFNQKEHIRVHKGWLKQEGHWNKKCPRCKKFYIVSEKNWYFRKQGKGAGSPTSFCKKCSSIVARLNKLAKKNEAKFSQSKRKTA